ncbi:MAG TPA: MBL fold metallo-hydrolase [Nitrososphaerales archaeon]|nr:MBL fold metallo-hydrolase [Nitrososphaerales archaeon]
MRPAITCYGGVHEIGGNKILVTDRDTSVFLDFGKSFSEGTDYFGAGIQPRQVNGAGDLFEFGLLPEIPGLYSEDALQNTALRHTKPEVDAVILSHYHTDHFDRISYLDKEIPVFCGATTELISKAAESSGGCPLEGHRISPFRTGGRFTVGSLEVVPIHVDHSIPGAYGFIVHTSGGTVAYTGDFRFHGHAGSLTDDFVRGAAAERPDVLVTEGTRVREDDPKERTDERTVAEETYRVLRDCQRLAFSSFRGNDIDRVNSFQEASARSGRTLVVSMKTAAILKELGKDPGLKVPRVGSDVKVYVKRKKSGKIDDKDYRRWERSFLGSGVTAQEVKKKQREVFLHLDVWNFPEIIDISPERGGMYIHSSSEAFNEEGEKEETVVRNWIEHLGFSYHQIHASGHAPMSEVKGLVEAIDAKVVVPVHTEHPELFRDFAKRVVEPQKGSAIPV